MRRSPLTDRYRMDWMAEGEYGSFRLVRNTVSADDARFGALIAMINGGGRYAPEGTYLTLYEGGTLWMSDTPDEIFDHLEAIDAAKDHCLVTGLGMGLVTAAMLDKPEVTHVTVIERNPEVVAFIGERLFARYGRERLTIVCADAFEYRPPKGLRYGAVWHDIWPTLCSDNLPEMAKLTRRYCRRAAWVGCWGKEQCRWAKRRGW
jgi:hypothetical protein